MEDSSKKEKPKFEIVQESNGLFQYICKHAAAALLKAQKISGTTRKSSDVGDVVILRDIALTH
jgi:hypothetical protein